MALSMACVCPASAVESRASFPGRADRLPSPDGQYRVRWVEARDAEHPHRLLLSHGQESVELLSFPRSVDVLWSPDSTHLAITNRWASDESTVLVWTDFASPPMDLLEALEMQEGQRVEHWGAHHLYLSVVRWTKTDSLELRLSGYGKVAVERRYVYTLGRAFRRM